MIWTKASELTQQGLSFVSITLVDLRGSAPQDRGAKCLVGKKGLESGTIGGGKVEAIAIDRALELLQSEKQTAPILLTWNLQKDIKMTCGGEVTLLFEHFPARSWPVVIFGAGHVSQALTRTLSKLRCQITIIDDRKEWIDKIQSENVQAILHNDPKKLISTFCENTFFISMTRGHSHDVPILHEISKHFPDSPYIGTIGSQSKANAIRQELESLNINDEFINKIKIPLGLPIGNNDPEEIAISIVAELLKVRDA
jgi:xanthine dehydrogenase accessory factor